MVCLLAVLKLCPLNSAENPALHMQMGHGHQALGDMPPMSSGCADDTPAS